MCEEIRDHHKRVACASYQLASVIGIEGEQRRNIVIAAALHDIGGLTMEARKCAALHFEDTNSHAEKGYKLLSVFKPFTEIATIVRYHHTKWNYGKGVEKDGSPLSIESQIVLLADRVSVSLNPGIHLLNQVPEVKENIFAQEGKTFQPELLDVFREISNKDAFWLNIMSQNFYDTIMKEIQTYDIVVSEEHLDEMLDLISNIIDFRSSFTATHSKSVAAVAAKLAQLIQMSPQDCHSIKVAALLHDIGKLAIPTEILEKPGPLTSYERDIIRTHSYYTEQVLEFLSGFDQINQWASTHHESPNGTGYPYSYTNQDLNAGSLILKVADIFVALMENRPYRSGMTTEQAMSILTGMAQNNDVDQTIVAVLAENIDQVNLLREKAETRANLEYNEFLQ